MTSTTFFFVFIPLLAFILLAINLIFAPHNPYPEKNSAFECGFHSFLGQNRTQFSISFFIFALLFLLFDLEILLIYPYIVSAYTNQMYGLVIMLMFFSVLTFGFAFELGKGALKINSRQMYSIAAKQSEVKSYYSGFMSLLSFSKTPLLNSYVNYKRYVNVNISSVLFVTFLVIFIFSLIPLIMLISLIFYHENFFTLLTENYNLNTFDYNFFSLLDYCYGLLVCIYEKRDFILENFFICLKVNPWFGVFFALKYILISIMTINLFVTFKNNTPKSNFLVIIISLMREFIILIFNDRKSLVKYLFLISSYKGVFFITLVMIWISVFIFRVLYHNTMDIHCDSITWWNQFDMLFSTFLVISLLAYCLVKFFIAKKLENKSSCFLDLTEIISSLTFVNFFSSCIMFFLCIHYISPYYLLIISYLGGLSFDIFLNTSGIILKWNPALKSVHGIYKNYSVPKFKLNTSFLYLDGKRLSVSVDKLVTEIKPPVYSLNRNASIKQKARLLSNIANLLVHRGIFKDTILCVKPFFVLSAISGKNVFSISSNNSNTDYLQLVETHEDKKSDIGEILKVYSKKKIFKIPYKDTFYYCVVRNGSLLTNSDDMTNAFHNKEILAIGKKIKSLNIMQKAIGPPFYNNNLEDSLKLLSISLKNRVGLPVYDELFSNIEPGNNGYILDNLSVYNKPSSNSLDILMGKPSDRDRILAEERYMHRFHDNLIVNMMRFDPPHLAIPNIGGVGDITHDVKRSPGLYLDNEGKWVYIISEKAFNILNTKHEAIDNLYFQANPFLSDSFFANELKYYPFTSDTYTHKKIALFMWDGQNITKSPLYGSTFKLDEDVKTELENLWYLYGKRWFKFDLYESNRMIKDLFFEIKSGHISYKVPIGFSLENKKKMHFFMDSEISYTKVEDISVSEEERAQSLADDLIARNYTKLVDKNLDLCLWYFGKELYKLPENCVLSNNELIYNLNPLVKTIIESDRKDYSNLYYKIASQYTLFKQDTFTEKPIFLYEKPVNKSDLKGKRKVYSESMYSGYIIKLDEQIKDILKYLFAYTPKGRSFTYENFDIYKRYRDARPLYIRAGVPTDLPSSSREKHKYLLTNATTRSPYPIMLAMSYAGPVCRDTSDFPVAPYPLPVPVPEASTSSSAALEVNKVNIFTLGEEDLSSLTTLPPSTAPESVETDPIAPESVETGRISPIVYTDGNSWRDNSMEDYDDLYDATPPHQQHLDHLPDNTLEALPPNFESGTVEIISPNEEIFGDINTEDLFPDLSVDEISRMNMDIFDDIIRERAEEFRLEDYLNMDQFDD